MTALVVTNLVAPDRAGAFAALAARADIELALFGGRSHHATGPVADPGVPHRNVAQRDVHALAASGRYDVVVCGTAGRVALPAAFSGARRSGTPFVLWSALWGQLTTPAHLAARPLTGAVHRGAACVVTYGPHVSAFARRLGARRTIEAPQAVDQAFWREELAAPRPLAEPGTTRFAFAGRDDRAKGLHVLRDAFARSGLAADGASLATIGSPRPEPPEVVRNFLTAADVVVVPSIRTRAFLEPWGLICNEAMHLSTPIIATDAVGAAAGGLVRHERNGLVVPADDPVALAAAMVRLHRDAPLRRRLGEAAARDAAPYTHDAWAAAFASALALAKKEE